MGNHGIVLWLCYVAGVAVKLGITFLGNNIGQAVAVVVLEYCVVSGVGVGVS